MTSTGDATIDDFPITWVEPSDAELTWEWDDMHMPTAVTPLAGDYNLLMGTGFAYGYERLSVPYEVLTRVWNNYTYFGWRKNIPDSESRRGRRSVHGCSAGCHPDHRGLLGGCRRGAPGDLRLDHRPSGRDGRASGPGRGMGRGVAADRPSVGHPLLRHPRPVPGHGRHRRPVRVGRHRCLARRGSRPHRRDRPRAPRGRTRARAPGRVGGRDDRGRASGPASRRHPRGGRRGRRRRAVHRCPRGLPGRAWPSRPDVRRPRLPVVDRGAGSPPDRDRQADRAFDAGRCRDEAPSAGGRGRCPRRPGASWPWRTTPNAWPGSRTCSSMPGGSAR